MNSDKGAKIRALISASESDPARKRMLDIGDRIAAYGYSPEKNPTFAAAEHCDHFFFRKTVGKTAEYLETIGPALYQENPDRRCVPKPWVQDPVKLQRTALLQDYLNYTPDELGLDRHHRRQVDEAMVYGMGVLWTGYNDRKGLVQSVFRPIKDFFADPDAHCWEEVNWVALRRKKPSWWLLNKYPDGKEAIAAAGHGARSESGQELVEYFEVYMRVGLHNYCNGQAVDHKEVDGEKYPITDDKPRKYVITTHGKVLWEGDWEIPLDRDDRWPAQVLIFREIPGQIWARPPLEPGLVYQEALDWIYACHMEKIRRTSRTVMARVSYNGLQIENDDMSRIVDGLPVEVLDIKINGVEPGTVKLTDLIQKIDMDSGVASFGPVVDMLNAAFERATGLSELVSMGQTQHQFRSAEEARIKDQNAKTRFMDMRVRVEKCATQVARAEAIAARWLHTGEDMARLFGPQAAQVWGELLPDGAEQQMVEAAQAQGIPPEIAMPRIQQQLASGVSFDEWLRETDCSIESGSTVRTNIEQQIASISESNTRVVPALLSNGLMVPAMLRIVMEDRLKKIPDDILRMQEQIIQQMIQGQGGLLPPPPPVPGGPGPAPEGAMP